MEPHAVTQAQVTEALQTCEPCLLGKAHRSSRPEVGFAAKEPLELVFTDLCGPMPVESSGGAVALALLSGLFGLPG